MKPVSVRHRGRPAWTAARSCTSEEVARLPAVLGADAAALRGTSVMARQTRAG
ncbi:MAG TPA: hypothetical protein VLQ93_22145 [Myxococcaceae bacterium]|nr:hypothetical protein [Myxococcaceae bacterium]